MNLADLRHDLPRRRVQDNVIELYYRIFHTKERDFVDGGANQGRHFIPMLRAAGSGRVVAFEPIPEFADALARRAAQLFLADKQWAVRKQALGALEATAAFTQFIDPEHSCFSGLTSLGQKFTTSPCSTIEVEVTTLDIVVRELDLDPQFVKLDLEGGEYHALLGSTNTLATRRPVVVFEDSGPEAAVSYGYSDEEFIDFFSELDYSLYYVTGHAVEREDWLLRNSEDRWRPLNIFAIPEEILNEQKLRAAIDYAYVLSGVPPLWH